MRHIQYRMIITGIDNEHQGTSRAYEVKGEAQAKYLKV